VNEHEQRLRNDELDRLEFYGLLEDERGAEESADFYARYNDSPDLLFAPTGVALTDVDSAAGGEQAGTSSHRPPACRPNLDESAPQAMEGDRAAAGPSAKPPRPGGPASASWEAFAWRPDHDEFVELCEAHGQVKALEMMRRA
jgi:hypothetical protein